MKALRDLPAKNISILFTDIDDTLTDDGLLPASSYSALWKLHEKNFHVVPITGRPAGWCEMIARFWPVRGIVGENGGFYFMYDRENKVMKRHFFNSQSERARNRKKLDAIAAEVLKKVPGSAVASDQFTRLMDLAIDFCEDVPRLPDEQVQKIVGIFEKHKAQAKVSSIHVNGWFGDYDKLSMCREFLEKELSLKWNDRDERCVFVGDSPNDEPLFAGFQNSVAVANIKAFLPQLKSKPRYLCSGKGAAGFCELAEHLLGRK